jgi:hypothetical protein
VGSAFEMMALCAFQLRAGVAEHVERAMEFYLKAKPAHPSLVPRLVSRCALLLVENGDRASTLRALLRASSGESDLGAAVLSEQAGFALLHAGVAHVRGGLVRKFAFQMVMAGACAGRRGGWVDGWMD